ncbi:uncharacterized protein isoform X2 [Leptinotarsa decemlineata]|uniref:uncharacterized protein isoform X2 n=1 Tax=Leptinotarsa decemlineata TaxID=7539 RepID=UPI003D30B2F6
MNPSLPLPLKFPTKLDGNDQNNDNPGPSSVLAPSKLDACTQTDTCQEVEQELIPNKETDYVLQSNKSVQSGLSQEFVEDVSCQTSSQLSDSSPRKQGLRRRIKELQSELKSSKRRKTVTREDVEQFLDEQYPQEVTMLMKNQLTLLDKNPKGARYSKEVKHFALSLFLLGPKAYKKLSKVMRLPSLSTLRKLTEHWKITPGFNEFIFKILELRVPLMSGKGKDCILCIDEMSIKSNLFYNVSRDVVVGFEDLQNKRSTNIATSALVTMVREFLIIGNNLFHISLQKIL